MINVPFKNGDIVVTVHGIKCIVVAAEEDIQGSLSNRIRVRYLEGKIGKEIWIDGNSCTLYEE